MQRTWSKLLLAAYTFGVIVFEGIFLLLASCALKLGWTPRKTEGNP